MIIRQQKTTTAAGAARQSKELHEEDDAGEEEAWSEVVGVNEDAEERTAALSAIQMMLIFSTIAKHLPIPPR